MNETKINRLLSLVLQLEFAGKQPVRAEKWYGRAAQKYVLDAIGDVTSAETVDEMHEGNEHRPYTVSTLFGFNRQDNGFLVPGRTFLLRITALNDQVITALQWATQPGGLMGIGTGVSLAKHPFIITGMNAEIPPGRYTSYDVIWEHFHKENIDLSDPVHIRIESPAYFKTVDFTQLLALKGPDGKTKAFLMEVDEQIKALVHHLPLPILFYSGIVEKWNLFAPEIYQIPPIFLQTLATEVFPQKVALESAAVKIFDKETDPIGDRETHHIGCKGDVFYNIGEKTSLEVKRLLCVLSAYSQFSGVGRDTTMGFGQCQHVK